jgi:hypothetical protein
MAEAKAPRSGSAMEDAIARVRPSIVAIGAGHAAGTGWVALGNGVIVTAHHAVGYAKEVTLELDDGTRLVGRVIVVDVARDLAFVLPSRPLKLAALRAAADSPRVGAAVVAVRRLPGEPVGASSGLLEVVPRGALPYQTDAATPEAIGAPLLDAAGLVIATCGAGGKAIPVVTSQQMLPGLDRPPDKLADLAPVYRCPPCGEAFSIENDRCFGCGALLPHAVFDAIAAPGHRLVKEILATMGVVANKVRLAATPGTRGDPSPPGCARWRLLVSSTAPGAGAPGATEVVVELGDQGRVIAFRVPLVRLPSAHHEPLFRLLLTMNDATTGPYRLSVSKDVVSVGLVQPAASVRERDAATLVRDLVRLAEIYKKALRERFGAEPVTLVHAAGRSSSA